MTRFQGVVIGTVLAPQLQDVTGMACIRRFEIISSSFLGHYVLTPSPPNATDSVQQEPKSNNWSIISSITEAAKT